MRWRIIATLVGKEYLRYRHNVGLLVIVIALLALAALVSLSDRYRIAARSAGIVTRAVIWHPPGSAWANDLMSQSRTADGRHRLPEGAFERHRQPVGVPDFGTLEFRAIGSGWPDYDEKTLPEGTLAVLLSEPDSPGSPRRAVFHYREAEQAGLAPFWDWIALESARHLEGAPTFLAYPAMINRDRPTSALARTPVSLLITALTIFAVYLCSFNIYITSTGEERERKIILALLLTPASAREYLAAKAVFYVVASLVVSLGVAAMFRIELLADPWLWSTLIIGSAGYLAIGTVAVCLVRRQSTINTVSMLYLIATSVVMILGQSFPLFGLIRRFLIENWLHGQLQTVIDGMHVPWEQFAIRQAALLGLVAAWGIVAVVLFERRGLVADRG